MQSPHPSPTPPPVICECGHDIAEHDRIGCWYVSENTTCACKKTDADVYTARVAALVAALNAIRYEAGNSDTRQACENIIFEADAALRGTK